MKNIRVLFASFFIVFLSSLLVFAEKTPVNDLYQYNLENGLTLFVAENHNVPLVYIEIAVRAGAVTQTPETAGLFHLYEHMMFKGNALYPDAASFDRASQDMGVSGKNGSTGIDCVNYFFTVPSDELENGLAFWNAAVRSPLMREDEFENEKRVVLAEIEGRKASPDTVYSYYVSKTLFPDSPYKLDPGGSFDSISNATIEQMREMQNKYYVPSNVALFVGGDVNPENVFELTKKIYGNWSGGEKKSSHEIPQQNTAPFAALGGEGSARGDNLAKFAVMPFDQLSPDIARIQISFRGPDADFDLEDTYTADYLLHVFDEPEGIFKQSLVQEKSIGIPDTDYAWASYATTRASSTIDFGAIVLSPEKNIVERVNLFLREIQDNIVPKVVNETSLYGSKKRKEITQKLIDQNTYAAQTVTGVLTDLRFWWTVASDSYYYDYSKNITKVRQKDAKEFSEKYITEKIPLVTLLVNPAVYENIKSSLEAAGYETISSENAFWWQDEKFAAATEKKVGGDYIGADTKIEDIYRPAKKSSDARSADSKSASKSSAKLIEKKLKNGIPVYVQQMENSQVSSVYVAVRGGIQNITPETSGLENALFTMMARSSEKYDYAARQNLAHEKNYAINVMSRVAGSALSLTSLDRYLYELLPVFLDGIVNPSYDEFVYDLMMTEYYQSIQGMTNDPQSLLSYEMSKTIYANHPYETRSQVMPDSVAQITIENMKALHEKIFAPENIFVVVAGNVNANKIVRQLNKSLGKIAPKDVTVLYSLDVPEVTVSGEPVVLTHPSVTGTGHVERVFRSPLPASDDYIPAVLASKMYSNVLYNVVREHYGACYTPQSFVNESKAPTGVEYLYRISNFTDFSRYMKEARDTFAAGNTIDSLDGEGNYVYAPISERLESYKNSYINETYSARQTVSSIAGELTYNLLQYNDRNFSEKQLGKIYGTGADDVMRVFKKYWIDEPSRWFVIVGPENKQLIIRN